ncbi:HD domain-containing protein [Tumebacillus sp. ITR2]|uniref:HD domain-containing protein n=1 Tax=Tumebacillus amylolyticus TaxID=2801339 RepID=A0ABS1JAV9_9BACL|nr:HD domain-containing protein [Tumebacillus amylolyticus]MBL0387398.1 HD domain-containing protein [Tumebacillus amylolyticus]
MERTWILQEAEAFVRQELGGDSSGHDVWHIERVRRMAERIARVEGADVFVCSLAALLHDIPDEKLNESPEAGMKKLTNWLDAHDLDADTRAHLLEIITTMSFKGGNRPPVRTLEGRIVQDADRLDAIGALGIARTFAYSGAKGQLSHDPTLPLRTDMTADEYRKGKSTAVNHFYEKLLLLKALMNTDAAKQIAEERHRYMEEFLERFHAEWEGQM